MTETTSMNDTKGKLTMTNEKTAMQCKGLLGDCKGFAIDPKTKTVAFDMGGEQALQLGFADLVSVELMADGYMCLGSHTWRDHGWFELRRAAARKHADAGGFDISNEPTRIDRVLICVKTSRLELPIVDLVLLHANKAMAVNHPTMADALKQAELWASRLNLCRKPASSAAL